MSYTEIYQVQKSGDVVAYDETHNSHRGAALVWHKMAIKYIPYIESDDDYFFMCYIPEDGMQKVWDLAKDERIPEAHRIVMASTFDRVIVPREDMQRVIDAMRQYAKDFDDPGTIPEQADILERMMGDADTWGVCWNQTNVNCGIWSRPHEELEDESRPYNINRDKGHWFMFQETIQ